MRRRSPAAASRTDARRAARATRDHPKGVGDGRAVRRGRLWWWAGFELWGVEHVERCIVADDIRIRGAAKHAAADRRDASDERDHAGRSRVLGLVPPSPDHGGLRRRLGRVSDAGIRPAACATRGRRRPGLGDGAGSSDAPCVEAAVSRAQIPPFERGLPHPVPVPRSLRRCRTRRAAPLCVSAPLRENSRLRARRWR